MKSLSVSEIRKKIPFEGVWYELESKKGFPETISYKISETNSSFHVKEHTTGKV